MIADRHATVMCNRYPNGACFIFTSLLGVLRYDVQTLLNGLFLGGEALHGLLIGEAFIKKIWVHNCPLGS